ncbi:hypothetical protein TRFO_32874 [Tritrichomonas foetus]|uniref:Uncharacterized protein n=1 Tax=Tritrichomonas foetus TaxID=1144522 RepID=A0A1J4JMW8_9EUKA|nr:hypothetical protein TRFO_32874 [Tritrichomonas foetus]|eukprot:OHT00465.1 hypothetical protein TRFO_32874 [Tritrichomonas foetus]
MKRTDINPTPTSSTTSKNREPKDDNTSTLESKKTQPPLQTQRFSNDEIVDLFSSDFNKKVEQDIRKVKNDLVQKVRANLLRYLSQNPDDKLYPNSQMSQMSTRKPANELRDFSEISDIKPGNISIPNKKQFDFPSIDQEGHHVSSNYQEEEGYYEENQNEPDNDDNQHSNNSQSDNIQEFNELDDFGQFASGHNPHVSYESNGNYDSSGNAGNDQYSDNINKYDREEGEIDGQMQSDKMPHEIFGDYNEEEESKSKFEFEEISQFQPNLKTDEFSRIENVKHYGSAASGSPVDEDDSQSHNLIHEDENDISNLSPVNKNDQNESAAGSQLSGYQENPDFQSDQFFDDFA